MNKQHYSEKFDLRDSYENLLKSQRKKSSPTLQTASSSDDRYLHTKPTASLGNKNNFPDQSDNWEKQFNQGSFLYNQAPAPPVSNEFQMASFDQYSNIYDDLDPQSNQGPPGPLGDIIPQAPQPPDIQWNQIQPAVQLPNRPIDLEEQLKKEAAIASEVRHQQATLLKQKEEYLRKVAVFKKELDTLKEQRTELKGSSRRSPSPDSRRFLKENGKLQLEIQTKLKTMHNVIDMLNGIIGDKTATSSSPPKVGKSKKSKKSKHSSNSSSSSPERDVKKSRSRSKSTTREKRFNYVYYDPEMHWCRLCNAFPPTAKDFLNHLHTAQHHRAAAAHMEAPWHAAPNLNEGLPNYPSATTKRTPIRGLQFFVPSTAWYCKLCDHWIGDLHCASAHLKSIMHSKNYSNFVEQNPHWETDWMSDRQKSFEKVRGTSAEVSKEKAVPYVAHTITFDKDGFSTKRKSEQSDADSASDKKKKEKKKSKKSKRRSSSSSSSSSRSSHRSRRDSKHRKIEKKDKSHSKQEDKNAKQEDRMLAQWMTLEENKFSDQDKRILDNLKRRVKKRTNESSEKQQEEQRRISREREARELAMLRARDAEKANKKRDNSHHNNQHSHAPKKHQADPSRGDKDKKATVDQKATADQKATTDQKATNDQKATTDQKTTDQKKMPFIGKMPVFKSLTKPASRTESLHPPKLSEGDEKKSDADVARRRAELDAEIQKKVAEFKDIMLRKKQENSVFRIAAPGLALPTTLGGSVSLEKPPMPIGLPAYNFPQTIHRVQKDPVLVSGASVTFSPHVVQAPRPNIINKNDPLHKDFQEALDIIFPSETKKEEEMKMDPMSVGIAHLTQMPPPNLAPAYPVMPAYPPPNGPMPMPGPGNGPNMMMGGMFDYKPQPTFIPAFDMSQHPGNRMNQPLQMHHPKMESNKKKHNVESQSAAKTKKNEDLDDLAMLGIDVEDVGASGF